MKKWFVYRPWNGFVLFSTEEEAQQEAEILLQEERDHSMEGWEEDVDEICWGELRQHVIQTNLRFRSVECTCLTKDDCDWPNHDYDCLCNYELVDVDDEEESM